MKHALALLPLIAAFASIFATTPLALAEDSAKAPKVGDEAPDFEMQGSDGKTYRLKDFKGKKPFVIAWFPKAFTGGWTAQCKSFRENGKAIREFDVAYFTASVDPIKRNKEFAESLHLDYPILSDPEKKAAQAFGVLSARGFSKRVTIYVDKAGKIAYIDNAVKASNDGAAVAKRLTELKFPKSSASSKAPDKKD